MLHVFGDLYVETEFRAYPTDNQINISMNTGFEKVAHPFVENEGKQFGWALSLDEFSSESFYELLRAAVDSERKVMIYVDSETYVRFYAALLKALLPGITEEMFKQFFICIKATYDHSTVSFYDSVMDHSLALKINRELVERYWTFEDPEIVTALRRLINSDPDKISLEWRVMKLFGTGYVGKVAKTIQNIMRRTAISNSHDAMEDWGRVIVDPTRWSVSGCTADGLLEADSTFQACVNFGNLSDPDLRIPGAMKKKASRAYLVELLTNIEKVLVDTGDLASANRSANLRKALEDESDMSDPENLKRRIRMLFDGGPATFRLANLDAAKYNENLIRTVIRLPEDLIKDLLKGAAW
jgi:hypothetical protein